MNTHTLARAIALTWSGSLLAAGFAPLAHASTTSYNTFNRDRSAPHVLVSGGTGTDGWLRTIANSCGAAGSYCGNGKDTGNQTNVGQPVPWVGNDPRTDPKFGYIGNQTLNWTAVLNSKSDRATISNDDSFARYGIRADIDTARGAWHDGSSDTGWSHDTDIGLFKSDVTQRVTLSIKSLRPGNPDLTPDYGITVFQGQTSFTGSYSHHQGWHVVDNPTALAVGDNVNPISENPPFPQGATGLTALVLDDVAGNGATFVAQAGVTYTIYLGGFQGGDWTETRNDYQLDIVGESATTTVPIPTLALWLMGGALLGTGWLAKVRRRPTSI